MLKPLFINKHFSNTSTLLRTVDVFDWLREGFLMSVCTRQTIHAIREWVRQNLICKQKCPTVEMNISKHSVSCILQKDLCRSVCSHCVSHLLDVRLKNKCYERYKKLLKRFQRFQKMYTAKFCLPTKKFSISRRNSIAEMTTYMPKVIIRPKTKSQGFQRGHHPLLVTVWQGVSYSVPPRFIFVTLV